MKSRPAVAPDQLTEKILDGALHEIAASGIRRLTLVDVAKRAGVGRVSLYRRFADKDRLLVALAQRETQRFYGAIADVSRRTTNIEERLVESFVTFMRFLRSHPLAHRLRAEPEVLVDYLSRDEALGFSLARSFIVEQLRTAKPARRGDVEQVAETMLRLAISFALPLPGALQFADDDAARSYARDVLVPIIASRPAPHRKRR